MITGFGLNLVGGREQSSPIYISRLIAGSVAGRCGRLQVGDELVAVNGVCVRGESHEKAVELLRAAVGTVTLTVEIRCAGCDDVVRARKIDRPSACFGRVAGRWSRRG